MIGQRDGLSETDIAKVSMVFGSECAERNRMYLISTCPSVVRSADAPPPAVPSECDIKGYFKDRLWPFGTITYKFQSHDDFSEFLFLSLPLAHYGSLLKIYMPVKRSASTL